MTATPVGRVAGVILAAGRSSRFGGSKLAVDLDGRPLVRHVLDTAIEAGLDPIVAVTRGDERAPGLDLHPARVVVNPHPDDGLSGSVRLGLAALDADPGIDRAVILLGDQPRIRASTIRALVEASTAEQPLTVARYSEDGAPNPIVAHREAWRLADDLAGDRGFGPILERHPELVRHVPVEGINPDVDTPADLLALRWADRVRANREQVDRRREVPDGADFYGPVTELFVADPDRRDDPVLGLLLALARPDDTWLDVGSGAGRYALPLARAVREVIALDPSAGMLRALREGMTRHAIGNLLVVEARWPPSIDPRAAGLAADVVLVAHVGYDIEHIGPFIDALEIAARRLLVAVMMNRPPASLADPFWPLVHGEERRALPALPELVALLEARGVRPEVRRVPRPGRVFASRDELLGFLRRQTWVAPGGERDRRLADELDRRLIRHPDGSVAIPDDRGEVGIVTWPPPRSSRSAVSDEGASGARSATH
jgi:molybdenum cofactor cytidylyltransferase